MHFCLVDAVLERTPDRIVTIKQVSAAEEYLQDHFPDFPVLPGVLMLEAMVQAARLLVEADPRAVPLVLGGVRAVKYGRFVQPGHRLRIEVSRTRGLDGGGHEFKGEGKVLSPNRSDPDPVNGAGLAVSGRFFLRSLQSGV